MPEEHHVDYRVTEETIAYLRERDTSAPFFLWTSFCSPHFPFDPPEEYWAKCAPEDMPVPIDCPPHKIDHYQTYLAAYCAMIEQLDHYIGKIVGELESQGSLDKTLVVFLSDHGDMMGDFGLFAKNFPYEGSSRVPFIARHPAMIRPGTYETPTEITDVVATFLQAAGEEDVRTVLPESPSKSLLPLWHGKPPARRYAFSENGYQFEAPFQMLVDANWKYIFYSFTGEEKLFNLKQDPKERHNIADAETKRVAEFRRLLLKRVASTPPPAPAEWVYQRVHDTTGPNPHRCHHGGLPEHPNEGLAALD